MALPNGTYYIENHNTHTSITRGAGAGAIVARLFTNPTTQKFQVTFNVDGYTIRNVNDGTYVAVNILAIGTEVISQNDPYNWDITQVGNGHYSITRKTAGYGDIAIQVISADTSKDVPVNMGSHVGSDTQRWHFTKL